MGSGLSFVGMSYCVKKRGPLFTAAFGPLIQIIVAIFDFSILHGQLHLGSVLGSILVIAGLYRAGPEGRSTKVDFGAARRRGSKIGFCLWVVCVK